MKRGVDRLFGLGVAIVVGAGTVMSDGISQGTNGLYLYEHVGYQGRVLHVRPFERASDLSLSWINFNDTASSARVRGPYRFRICQHANFEGNCTCVGADVPDFRLIEVGNDEASSAGWASQRLSCP